MRCIEPTICVKLGVILVVIHVIKMVVPSYIIIIIQSMRKVVEFRGCCGHVGGVLVAGNTAITCCYQLNESTCTKSRLRFKTNLSMKSCTSVCFVTFYLKIPTNIKV